MVRTPIVKTVYMAVLAIGPVGTAYGQSVDLASTMIIDLSHAFDANTIYWPTEASGFELRPQHKGLTKAGFFYYSNTFCALEEAVRPRLIGGATKLPFLWVLLGILGGVESFQLLGLFLGPAIMAALMLLWRELTASPCALR